MNKYSKLFLATLLSIIGLFFAFKGENLDELSYHMVRVDITGITLASILLILSCFVRAFRWQLLLRPFDHITFSQVFGATMVGYFGNGVLAFRLGELLKAYSVTKNNKKINLMQSFGTVIIERILDVGAVIAIFALLIPWFPFDDKYIKYGAFGFTGITLIIIFSLYLAIKYSWINKIKGYKIFKSKHGQKLLLSFDSLFEGLTILNRTNSSLQIISSSIVLWSIYFIETIILIKACGLDMGVIDAGIILFLGSIAIGIPALPGSAGTYDAGIKYSLIIVFGIASERALNYAIISHAVAYFPLLIIGFFYFLIGNVSLTEIKRIESVK